MQGMIASVISKEEAKARISANVDRLCQERGLSWYRLSQLVGVSDQQIANICNGRHEPTASLLNRIAEALECSMDDLMAAPRQSRKKPEKVRTRA